MIAPLIFFLLGIPAAFVANQLILRLVDIPEIEEEDEEDSLEVRHLPWQIGDWPVRVRLLLSACVPALTALAAWRFEPVQAAAVSLLLVALLVCTATDLLRYRVPNVITYPGILFAIAASVLLPEADLMSAVLAALLGGAVFLAMAIASRGGLGLGDVKLAVLIGAALGLSGAYQALALGIVFGGLVILVLFVTGVVGRRQAVPYAPFLAFAAVLVMLLHGAAFAPL